MSATSDISDAVVTYLNALGLGFVAVRQNVWVESLETDSIVHVVVIPVESNLLEGTRGGLTRSLRVDCVVQQKLQGLGSQTQILERQDVLINLSEQIESSLYGVQMGDASFLQGDGGGPRTLYDAGDFVNSGLFRTIIQLTYVGDM